MLRRASRVCLIAGSAFIIDLQEFERGNQQRNEQAKQRVHSANMGELVSVRQVLAIPRGEKVAAVVRGQREVQSIAKRVPRHHSSGNVRLHDIEDSGL